jgi:hypothetical protein
LKLIEAGTFPDSRDRECLCVRDRNGRQKRGQAKYKTILTDVEGKEKE